MTVTSAPAGIPGASRLAGWTGGGGPCGAGGERARPAGRDNSRIGCCVAFGYLKLAVVLEGICARYQLHLTVGEGFGHKGLAVPTLVARAHQVLGADDLLQATRRRKVWGVRRPARAGPEPGAPLSPGPPLGFRLPSCRGPAPRLRRTSKQTTRYPGGGFTRE